MLVFLYKSIKPIEVTPLVQLIDVIAKAFLVCKLFTKTKYEP